MELERKTFPAITTKVDEAQGIVEALVAVMGVRDLGDDVIHPGAFTKTLAERKRKVRVLDQHNTDSVLRVLGRPLDIREIGRAELPPELLARFPEATGGLWTRTQYNLKTQAGHDAFQHIAAGDVDEYSFGYEPIAGKVDHTRVDGRTVRNLREVGLWEYSPALWGLNPATMTTDVKTVSGAANLPLGPRNRAWDAAAAEARVRAWAGGEDAMDWSKYRKAFFWYDGEAPEAFTSYKLQFADVLDGTLTAIPRGLFAVAGALQGARQPLAIPEAEQAAIRRKVAAYYAKMRETFDDDAIVPPWDKSAQPPLNKAVNLSERVDQVTAAFYAQYPDIHDPAGRVHLVYWVRAVWDGFVVVEQRGSQGQRWWKIVYALGEANGDTAPAVGAGVQFAAPDEWLEITYVPMPLAMAEALGETLALELDLEEKTGRVQARRNAQRLRGILKLLRELMQDAGLSDDDEQPADDDGSKAEPDPPPGGDLRPLTLREKRMRAAHAALSLQPTGE